MAITGNTLTGLTRLKIFYVLLLFALLLIGSSVFMARMTFQQEFQMLKDIALGAMSIFTSLLAVLATARLLPQDIEDRTVYTILAKPVSRFEYLSGKLLGVLLLLAISLAAMSALFFIVLTLREQAVLTETTRQLAATPPEQMAEALRLVRDSAFNVNLFSGIGVIYAKACLLAALTLFVSTFATTTIFTTIVMVFVYFIGHLQAIAREYWLETNSAGWLTKTFLGLVALVFPDLQLFNLTDDIVAGNAIPLALFAKTAALGPVLHGLLFAARLGRFFPERNMIRGLVVVLGVAIFGAAKLPVEHAISREHRRLHFRAVDFNLDLREQLGQLGFVAALSGFRSLVADVLFIQAHVAWERTEWGRVLLLFRQVTTLQPRALLFWDMARLAHGVECERRGLERPHAAAPRAARQSATRIFRARPRLPGTRNQK